MHRLIFLPRRLTVPGASRTGLADARGHWHCQPFRILGITLVSNPSPRDFPKESGYETSITPKLVYFAEKGGSGAATNRRCSSHGLCTLSVAPLCVSLCAMASSNKPKNLVLLSPKLDSQPHFSLPLREEPNEIRRMHSLLC